MSAEHVVSVAERYQIQWRNGQWHVGDIVGIRPIKRIRDSNSNANTKDLKLEENEYYIHYPGFDRRLDEWVTSDRIDLATASAGEKDAHDGHIHGNHKSKKMKKMKHEDVSTALDTGDKKDGKEAMLSALVKEDEEITKVKNIPYITLGKFEIETWYYSPYPDEYSGEDMMCVCEYCLKYVRRHRTLVNHSFKCSNKRPPGLQIYTEKDISMFEIDGKEHKIYCQNLCLLSKLFLDHKTLYYDVDPFLFYVLCEVDDRGAHHIVGYFSKEKNSQENYNLACILTFPPYQRKGYGKFLMSVSYELTKREGGTGSPEKPLSDLGKISYRSYWAYIILRMLEDSYNHTPLFPSFEKLSILDISRTTGIKNEDITSTLHSLNMIKIWKGQHLITINKIAVANHLKQVKKIRLAKPDCLTWQPPDKGLKEKVNKHSSDRSLTERSLNI